MPVTNYYSVGGKILGHKVQGQPASSRVDYQTDALGSVTATTNQAGVVQSTRRYKPYGSLLAKVGADPDPAFTWVGSHGYKQTGKKYSDVYVRARHYSNKIGRWISSDPLKYHDGLCNTCYVKARVTSEIDPTGLLSTTFAGRTNDCTGVVFDIIWQVDNTFSGYIIQHVRQDIRVFDCNNNLLPNPNPRNPFDFYEAFRVIAGKPESADRFAAVFSYSAIGQKIHGQVSAIGSAIEVRVNVLSTSCPAGMTRGKVKNAMGLCSSLDAPPIWKDNAKKKRHTPHRLDYKWNCCCTPPKCMQLVTVPASVHDHSVHGASSPCKIPSLVVS